MVDMGHESLNGVREKTQKSVDRADILSRANEVTKLLKQPKLEFLYKRHKRPFPSDIEAANILRILYAARLCLAFDGSLTQPQDDKIAINGVKLRRVKLDEVFLEAGKAERIEASRPFRPEMDFIKSQTPFYGKEVLITEKVPDIED